MIDAKQFGAKGDGLTDDTAVLKGFSNTNEKIRIPNGTYVITSTLKLTNVEIEGQSRNKTIFYIANDVDGIYLDMNSKLSNITVKVCPNYTKKALSVIGAQLSQLNVQVNIKASQIDIINTNTSVTSCVALNLESDTNKGYYGLIFNEIQISGVWNYGILNNYILTAVGQKPWIHKVSMNNVFIHSAKYAICFMYTDNTPGKTIVPSTVWPFNHHMYNNVSAQYIDNVSERFFVAENVKQSSFDNCNPYDYFRSTVKTYYLTNNSNLKISLNGVYELNNAESFIEFKSNGKSFGKNFEECIVHYLNFDYGRQNALFEGHVFSNSELDDMKNNNPQQLVRFFSNLQPYLSSKKRFWNFHGLSMTPNGLVNSNGAGSFQLGTNGGGQLIFRSHNGNQWSDWGIVHNEIDMPNGYTARRTANPCIGSMFFDTILNKPIWCKTQGIKEVYTLTINKGATSFGNVSVVLNGITTTILVSAGDTVGVIGDKIRKTNFSDWVVGGTTGSATVIFTKVDNGKNTPPVFIDAGSTGTKASFVVTTPGTNNVWVNSDNVVPENKGINVPVTASTTTKIIAFTATEADNNYAVNVSLGWNSTLWITNKTNTGFTINFGTAPTGTSSLDWTINR
ncbi:hypothetical protein FQP34_17445 [Peribacillus simplex]|uniref:Rhamnogalacturonase A/B/Epimerase-like pectate lyase domain-containing protein n=1 Tax=Peribacillus simplex TaxID=1478 RepID=A0A8B5XWE1_9BACI|nr:glycosyl hydrolase family 28-related protein [Peribacillus simplex]TVX79121.1 hypothetical protein FQP34_17445 [Peribacillus simplex]